jgi:hypothetical protein
MANETASSDREATEIEMNTQEGRSAFAFLRWLKDNDIGVGLCNLHESPTSRVIVDSAGQRTRVYSLLQELTPIEWVTLIEEWENDDGETDPGRDGLP